MTPIEFKNWFDGYTEQIVGPPSVAQWVRIVEQFHTVSWTSIALGGIPNGPLAYPPGIRSPYLGDAISYSSDVAEKRSIEMREALCKADSNGASLLGRQSLSDADIKRATD